jgi:hypothetical protein
MSIFDKFPFTNTHEINLDWVLATMKECVAKVEAAVEKIATLTANFLPAKKNSLGGYDVSDAVNLTGKAHAVKPSGSDTAAIATAGYCDDQLLAAKEFTNTTVTAAVSASEAKMAAKIKDEALPARKSTSVANRYIVGVDTDFNGSPQVPSNIGDVGHGDVGRWSDSLKLLTMSMDSPILTATKTLTSKTIDFAEQSFDFGMTLALRFWATGNPELIFQCVLTLPTAQEVEAIGNVFFLNCAILSDASTGEQIIIAAECQASVGNRLTRTQQNVPGSCIKVSLAATSNGFENNELYSNVSYTLKPF